jgi:hypothetical protein
LICAFRLAYFGTMSPPMVGTRRPPVKLHRERPKAFALD